MDTPSTTEKIIPLWKNLKSLVEFDKKMEGLASEIRGLEKKIEEDQAMIPELEQTISQAKQAAINAKKNVDLQELNAEHLSEQEKVKRKALKIIKKQKEYEAIERELNSILVQLKEHDDALVQAWHNLEAAKKKEEAETTKLNEKIELLKKDITEKEESIVAIKKDHSEVDKQRSEQASLIPPDWLSKYERMKNRVPDPIVPLANTSCSSCYYSVPPQDITRLKRNAILPCRSCYRFLYYSQEEETDLSEAQF